MQDGKTDYKSVTVASNATAEEFIDFYFDDIARMRWVSHNACVETSIIDSDFQPPSLVHLKALA